MTGELFEKRTYKYRNPLVNFYCPLCRVPRGLIYRSKLSVKHYVQMAIISIIFVFFLYPLMELRAIFVVFVVWALFEGGNKIFFRKNIICPRCGFDATWYKRDVKMANRLVKDFLEGKGPKIKAE